MPDYNVNNIPWLIRPMYLLLSCLLALPVYSLFVISHFVCRIEFKGSENLATGANYIYCMWHDNLIPYFIVNIRYRSKYVWLNHPVWFMKPVHNLLYLIGTKKIALGSSGHSGKAALPVVVEYLKKGYNTVITPDGPSGPVKTLKDGVLEMAMKSGVPVVPLKIITHRAMLLRATWDDKRIPMPFSFITVEYGNPIIVTGENYEIAKMQIIAGL